MNNMPPHVPGGLSGCTAKHSDFYGVMKQDVIKQDLPGGGQRGTQEGKLRFDLLWTKSQGFGRQMLVRDAEWYAQGAKKYGERNWEDFCTQEALDRCEGSLLRHTFQLLHGDRSEDHAAAIRANVQFIEYIRERMEDRE